MEHVFRSKNKTSKQDTKIEIEVVRTPPWELEQMVGSKISGTSNGDVAIPDRLVEKVGRIDDGKTVDNPLESLYKIQEKEWIMQGVWS